MKEETVLGIGLRVLAGWAILAGSRGATADEPPRPTTPAVTPRGEGDLPPLEPPGVLEDDGTPSPSATAEEPLHEALRTAAGEGRSRKIATRPPRPIGERPGSGRPGVDAQWIEGYWDWDASANEFVWVTGTWLVPPPGKLWLPGYWQRDQDGWVRVPGSWADRDAKRPARPDAAPDPPRRDSAPTEARHEVARPVSGPPQLPQAQPARTTATGNPASAASRPQPFPDRPGPPNSDRVPTAFPPSSVAPYGATSPTPPPGVDRYGRALPAGARPVVVFDRYGRPILVPPPGGLSQGGRDESTAPPNARPSPPRRPGPLGRIFGRRR